MGNNQRRIRSLNSGIKHRKNLRWKERFKKTTKKLRWK